MSRGSEGSRRSPTAAPGPSARVPPIARSSSARFAPRFDSSQAPARRRPTRLRVAGSCRSGRMSARSVACLVCRFALRDRPLYPADTATSRMAKSSGLPSTPMPGRCSSAATESGPMSIRIAAAALPCTFGILLVVLALMSASSSPTAVTRRSPVSETSDSAMRYPPALPSARACAADPAPHTRSTPLRLRPRSASHTTLYRKEPMPRNCPRSA